MWFAIIRTWLYTLPLIALVTAYYGTLSLFVSSGRATGRTAHRIARAWARAILWISRVKVDVEGLEKIPPGGSYVFVANHRSFYDIPAILPNIAVQFRFLAKKSLFSVPFLGTHLKRAGHFPVNYDSARESLKSMADAAHLIQEREVSVLLFPEGTRTMGGMDPFKDGAAYIAITAGVPVIPIGLTGTKEILKMHGRYIRPGRVKMRIGDPIPTIDLTLADRTFLTQQMYDRVCELIGEKVPGPAERTAAV